MDKQDDCCNTICLPGGTYSRSYYPDSIVAGSQDARYEATISPVFLDAYEVTVRRFNVFRASTASTSIGAPMAGTGAYQSYPGWQLGWSLPGSSEMYQTRWDNVTYCTGRAAWGSEDLPVNCVSWYEAQRFCMWDGGRLPTEAEWNFAFSGGNEHRKYPWGNDDPLETYGLLCGEGFSSNDPQCLVPTAFRQPGGYADEARGRWGHADLAFSLVEWTLDSGPSQTDEVPPSQYEQPCSDCVHWDSNEDHRMIRGDAVIGAPDTLDNGHRFSESAGVTASTGTGFRCARPAKLPN